MRRVLNAATAVGTRNIQRKLGHRSPGTRGEEEEYREESDGRRRTKIMESAVITSAGLNGGISRYLWHNFTGFTMAYIRGPAERISPRGTHICSTETFVIPCLRPARWSPQSSLLVGPLLFAEYVLPLFPRPHMFSFTLFRTGTTFSRCFWYARKSYEGATSWQLATSASAFREIKPTTITRCSYEVSFHNTFTLLIICFIVFKKYFKLFIRLQKYKFNLPTVCNIGIAEIQIYRGLFVSIGFLIDCRRCKFVSIYENTIRTSIYKPNAPGCPDVFQCDRRRCIFYDFADK